MLARFRSATTPGIDMGDQKRTRKSSLCTDIHTLPDDLLLPIILMSVEPTSLNFARVALPMVCRRWHSILRANGQLWSVLDFPTISSLAHGVDMLALSKDVPLSLVRITRLASFQGSELRKRAFLEYVRANQYRYLRLDLVTWELGRRIVKPAEAFPLLSELDIAFSINREDESLLDFLRLARMPSLRRVKLRQTCLQFLQCGYALFSQITHLTFSIGIEGLLSLAGVAITLLPLKQLEVLRIELKSRFGNDGITSADLPPESAYDEPIVHPVLRDLVIEGGVYEPNVGFRKPWELPSLRTLMLPHQILRECLAHFAAPGVQTFICEHIDWGMDLITVIAAKWPRLRALYIFTQIQLNIAPLHTVLTELQCLVLKSSTWWNDNSTAVLGSLSEPDASGVWTCPHLETLDLGKERHEEDAQRYLRLVQVRARSADVGALRCVAVSQLSPRLREKMEPFVRDMCESVTKTSLVPADIRL